MFGKAPLWWKSDKNDWYFTRRRFYMCVPGFLLGREMLQSMFLQEIETHFLFKIFFSRKSRRLWDDVEVYVAARQAICDKTDNVRIT